MLKHKDLKKTNITNVQRSFTHYPTPLFAGLNNLPYKFIEIIDIDVSI